VILLKVLEYLAYKVQHAGFNTDDIIEDFSERIDPYIALELWAFHPPISYTRVFVADWR